MAANNSFIRREQKSGGSPSAFFMPPVFLPISQKSLFCWHTAKSGVLYASELRGTAPLSTDRAPFV